MAHLQELEPIVRHELEENPITRDDNFVLYVAVLKRFIDVTAPFEFVCLNHKELKIPSLESITRVRRKLQERHPELRGNNRRRLDEEEEYIEYAIVDKLHP